MPNLCPQTLTADELHALMAAVDHPRDVAIFSLALGTGLRLGEVAGLNVGDVYFPTGAPRGRIRVRKEIAKRGRTGDVFVPRALVPRLERLWAWKVERGEAMDPDAPLLCALSRRRLSKRRIQVVFREWQERAGLDRVYPFHALRHYADLRIMPPGGDLAVSFGALRPGAPTWGGIIREPPGTRGADLRDGSDRA